jgi:hypothetical protein
VRCNYKSKYREILIDNGQALYYSHSQITKARLMMSKPICGISAIVLALAGSAGPVRADCSAKLSDSTFQGGSIQLTWLGSTSHPRSFYINRVVGPGTGSEFDSAGFLNNWQT